MDGQYLPDDEIDIDSLASSEPPEYVPQMFSEGGEVQEEDIEYYAKGGEASFDQSVETMNKYLLADEEDAMPTAYATTPYGVSERAAPEMSTKTAKLMLKQLSTKGGGGGKSKRPKEMSLEAGDLSPAIPELGAPQTEQDKLVQIATARAQYDALERAYQLKAQAAQKAGRGLMRPTFNALAFDKPTLEKPGPLMARTFAKGGEADALEGMQKKARENEMYRASEKYLNSRGQIPDIELERMGLKDSAVFSSLNLPIGSGTITINKDDIDRNSNSNIGPALLAHEITHAADRQMKQQAIEQRGKNTKFAEAYEKLMGSEGRNRLEPARRADYEWTEGNRFYRSTPAAFGVGAFSEPMPKHMMPDRAPLHVDPTAATEFQILLDLAQRDIDKGPKGLERIPAFARKFFKYADGGPVYRAEGSPAAKIFQSARDEYNRQEKELLRLDKPTLEKMARPLARTFQAGGLVRALKSGAKKGASSVDNVVPSSARSLFPEEGPSFLPSIIKEEGGNWMTLQKNLRPLYKNLNDPAKANSLNKWIDKKLVPYVKNKMGTPSDPVRIQAEKEGILPFPDTVVNAEITSYQNRIAAGLPIEQQAPISKTDRGQAWENRADAAIRVRPLPRHGSVWLLK
jgi:hypothetical protein